jgi:DNA-binding Lrp family transcriptional regulator
MTTLPVPSSFIYVKYVTMEGPLMPTLSRLLARASSEVLEDEINLLLLRNLVSGRCVSVNLSALSKATGRHRITVRNEVTELLEQKVVNPPVCPFMGLYREYPLLVVVRADLPDEKRVNDWVAQDRHIFAAYWSRHAEYNMILLIYQKDVLAYQLWRESLTEEHKIPPREARLPSYSLYVSNQLMIKYEPNAAIGLMEAEINRSGKLEINGVTLDRAHFEILKLLVTGGVFKLNENFLSRELRIHRKTVMKRVDQLLGQGWILKPVCRFPDLLCPPNYVVAYSMAEIRKARERVMLAFQNDPHVSMALRVSIGGYNLLLMSAHPDISEHMEWEQSLSKRFPSSIGRVDVTYLSPRTKILIDQQKVSLGIIEEKLAQARGRRMRKTAS